MHVPTCLRRRRLCAQQRLLLQFESPELVLSPLPRAHVAGSFYDGIANYRWVVDCALSHMSAQGPASARVSLRLLCAVCCTVFAVPVAACSRYALLLPLLP